VLIPVGIFMLSSLVRKNSRIREIALFSIGQFHGFILFLLYNTFQNGGPLVTGYHVADSWMDKWFDPTLPTLSYDVSYLIDLLTWSLPCLPLLIFVTLFTSTPGSARRWERCFAAILFALIAAYTLIAFHEGPSYGPRYYYAGFLAIPLLGVRGLARLLEKLPTYVFTVLVLSGTVLSVAFVCPYYSSLVSPDVNRMNDFERQVQRIKPGPVLVFIARDPDSGQAQTRNRIDFQGDTVYAMDWGEENSRLMRAYPGRRYFRYEYYRKTGQSTLREITARGL